ncbi:BC1881 family protein [Bacillus cereus]
MKKTTCEISEELIKRKGIISLNLNPYEECVMNTSSTA